MVSLRHGLNYIKNIDAFTTSKGRFAMAKTLVQTKSVGSSGNNDIIT